MDWLIEDTDVVLLGAGFSAAATNGKLPLMAGYFDRLHRDEFPDLYSFVREVGCNRVCKTVELANVEQVLLALEQIRTSPAAALEHWLGIWKSNYQELQRQLSFYTLTRLGEGLSSSRDNWAANLLTRVGPRTTIVSMNYDNIAEQILSNRSGLTHDDCSPSCPHCKMRLLLQQACSCDLRMPVTDDSWRGAILKPHGSIAWRRCLNADCCSYECLVADRHCKPFKPCKCPDCRAECAPVLVMPTMAKNLSDMPEISSMWQATRLAMQDAESLLLFGFSLPTSDELLRQLIRSACEIGGKLKRVASIDLEPVHILERFESCLPPTFEVETVALPVEKGAVPVWLDLIEGVLVSRG